VLGGDRHGQLDDLGHREVGAERLEDRVGHGGRRGGDGLGVGERGPLGVREEQALPELLDDLELLQRGAVAHPPG
jgi:hypothetical protein